MSYLYSYQTTRKSEYRFPGFHWNPYEQRWIPDFNTLPASCEVVHEQIDPSALPPPSYRPGQWVIFEDIQGRRHRGHIEGITISGASTNDSNQREYLYQWTYLSINSMVYWIRLANGPLYSVYGSAILGTAAVSRSS